jgi:hypothetical protein
MGPICAFPSVLAFRFMLAPRPASSLGLFLPATLTIVVQQVVNLLR